MDLALPPPELVPYGFRAFKTIALANGRFDEQERELLKAIQVLHGNTEDLDAMGTITPAELAAAVKDPQLRQQLFHGMIVMAMVDEDASASELAVLTGFADMLGIDLRDLEVFGRLARQESIRLALDLSRRLWVREKIAQQAKEGGLGWIVRALASVAGLVEDTAVAAKYQAFERLPPGSLGRCYFDFIRSNHFSLPGEKGGLPEPALFHDLTHVLSGYGTDPVGELQVGFFHAGCGRKDPYASILFAMMQFHMGQKLGPVAGAEHGLFEPKRQLLALRRGAACAIDPTDGWDFWPVIARPLEELRAEYRIAPLP